MRWLECFRVKPVDVKTLVQKIANEFKEHSTNGKRKN
jgi:hypothetical protein